jgi:hypothetical protein
MIDEVAICLLRRELATDERALRSACGTFLKPSPQLPDLG